MSTELQHHPMGPSSLFRREACPASLRLEQGRPEETNEYAEDGTDKHAIVADALKNAGDFFCEEADAEMVRWCIALADELAERYPGADRLIERRVNLMHLGIGFGTADFGLVIPFDRGVVLDWKFGWGDVASAETNIQGHAYALGLAHEFDLESVEVVLAQPAKRHYSTHILDAAGMQLAKARILEVEAKCADPAAKVRPGDHCKYCKARTVCPALAEQTTALTVNQKPVDDLSPEAIGTALAVCEVADAYIGSIRARAYALAMQGVKVPGWTLAPGRSTRGWCDDVGPKLAALAKTLGKPEGEIYAPLEVRSPAQIEEVWGKSKKVREAMASLIVSKPGREKLVKE